MVIRIDRRALFLGTLAAISLPSGADASPKSWYIGTIPDRPFDIKTVDKSLIPAQMHRRVVPFATAEVVGTIIVDKQARFLYYIDSPTRAIRYGIAVGREGLKWSGTAVIGRKAIWPSWTPTANMRRVDPSLPQRVAGGPQNPLGARALYLYRDGRDTLYRVHGTNQPWTIGRASSAGCIRMLNEHILELYGTVKKGTRVVVF
jgi:lipoprotein-anchoring transpeptidase ErfK/SrfK